MIQLIYEKLPSDISERHVLLLDPVLGTGSFISFSFSALGACRCIFSESFHWIYLEGNSANQAIELLIQKGVPESHIIFLNLISVSVKLINQRYFIAQLVLSVTHSQPIPHPAGSRGNPLRLQTVSKVEDCDVRNRSVSERRVPGHTRLG